MELCKLPDELLVFILSWLDDRSLSIISKTNKRLHQLANDDLLWKTLCDQRWRDRCLKGLETIHLRYPEEPSTIKSISTSEWKRKYGNAERDAKRELITFQELCELPWKFQAEWVTAHVARFNKNHSFVGGGHAGALPFVLYRTMSTSGQLQTRVRVHEYPSLVITRRKEDWGWEMTNRHVVLSSITNEVELTALRRVEIFAFD